MIKNNKEKNKSAGLWAQQLFRQTSTLPLLTHGKTHFLHFYPSDQNQLNNDPFHRLFSDEVINSSGRVRDGAGLPVLLQDELIWLKAGHEQTEPPLNSASTGLNKQEGGLCHKSRQFSVMDCFEETRDTKTFRLRTADAQQFDYLPGQYLTLSVVISGKEYKRSYSLASTPTRPGSLEITVKRDPNAGVVSNWLNDHLKEGDKLTMKGPFGQFTCARALPPKILFLAAGSGIVPIMSMLRWLTDTHADSDVAILLSFRTQYDIIYGDELKWISARHNNIKIYIALSQEPLLYSSWAGLTGRVTLKMIAACIPDVSERVVYQCGPDAFMAANQQYLQTLGVPDGQLFNERFSVSAAPAQEPAARQNASIGRPSRRQTGSYLIRFAKSGKTVTADGADNLLELAEKSGVAISHECRSGNCGECMVKNLKGAIEMTAEAEIDHIDQEKGWIYACCSYPVSDVVLDI